MTKITKAVRYKMTDEKVIAAIKNSGGVMSTISKKLGVDWNTADKYIRKSRKWHKLLHYEIEFILDACEINLFDEAVNKKESWAIRFLLATKGKHRGYIQGTDITTKGNEVGNSTIIILPANNRDKSIT